MGSGSTGATAASHDESQEGLTSQASRDSEGGSYRSDKSLVGREANADEVPSNGCHGQPSPIIAGGNGAEGLTSRTGMTGGVSEYDEGGVVVGDHVVRGGD